MLTQSKSVDIKHQVVRQVGHWTQAAKRLSELDELASATAWEGLEQYLNLTLRESLQHSLERLQKRADILAQRLSEAHSPAQVSRIQKETDIFRKQYLKTETTLDFYADAINTRTSPKMTALMRACDRMAFLSMTAILTPLGKQVPPVLTYNPKNPSILSP